MLLAFRSRESFLVRAFRQLRLARTLTVALVVLLKVAVKLLAVGRRVGDDQLVQRRLLERLRLSLRLIAFGRLLLGCTALKFGVVVCCEWHFVFIGLARYQEQLSEFNLRHHLLPRCNEFQKLVRLELGYDFAGRFLDR